MDQQRQRILEDLRGSVRGDLRFDDLTCALYSTDASIFQIFPLGVVVPKDEGDVQTLVRYAGEHELSLTARGAGSGVAGESLTSGLILDFSTNFRTIGEIKADTVRVQVGVVLRELNAALAKTGCRFAPDSASEMQCTIGGMLATNASGARALKYGYTRDHVAQVRVVQDTGDADDYGLESRLGPIGGTARKQAIVDQLASLLEKNDELIQACAPRTRFNRCGYLLHDLKSNQHADMGRMLVGSEGTLGLFTEATLRTVPLPVERSLLLLGFDRMDGAARAIQRCLPSNPSACELVDRRLLALTCEAYREYERVISPAMQAVLLVEFEADQPGEAHRQARQLAKDFQREPGVLQALASTDDQEIHWLWRIRDLALPLLHSLKGKAQPIPFLEDVGVPVEHLGDYLHRIQDVLQRHRTTASFLIHGGAGQVHTRPFLDLTHRHAKDTLRRLTEDVYELVLSMGGTISTQHGVGLARTPWVAQQYGRLYHVQQEIKNIFDPRNLFNPGKIIPTATTPAEFPHAPLRKDPHGHEPRDGWLLRWSENQVAAQCRNCNGCGNCRVEEPGQRMCPLFRVQHDEAATPRAKANLLRSFLDTTLPAADLTCDDVRSVADLCINCKMCARECPAHVQIPKLMLEAKAQNVKENGMHLGQWVLARTEDFAAIGSAFSLLVNAGMRSRGIRWLLERVFGISRRRRLPTFAFRSFMTRAKERGWTQMPTDARKPRLAYFVDIFANYNDPQIAEATVAVLHHNGLEVYVPPGQVGCGIAPLSQGDVRAARKMAERNIRILADLARAGFTILCSEPTAALMLQQDYRDLIDDPDVGRIADHTVELASFLWSLQQQGRLKHEFQPLDVTVGYHVPCHLKALGLGDAGPRLLSLIPRLRALTIDMSCSGMAGTYGLGAKNFDASLAAGKPMLDRLRQEDIHFGASECSACRMQMEQGSGKRSLHPVQYLALAYGLMPEVAQRLREPVGNLVL